MALKGDLLDGGNYKVYGSDLYFVLVVL